MFKKFLFALVALSCNFSALAQFNYEGKGNLIYPTGTTSPFEFGFTYGSGEEGNFFKVGKHTIDVEEVPKNYSLWITLHEEKYVYIQEFAKGYFQEFDWQLGDHQIKLSKKVFANNPVKGDYVLTIDGEDYYFFRNSVHIQINFNAKGITGIDTGGFVRAVISKE